MIIPLKLIRNQDLRAMKVLSADCYGADDEIFELEILKHLRGTPQEYPGYQYISTLQDHFEHQGPNGNHVCLVFKVMAESLRTFCSWFDGDQIPSPLVQKFTKQLLQAIDLAHSSGVIHTDIQPGNIMVQLPDESFIHQYLQETEVQANEQEDAQDSVITTTQGLRDFYFNEGFNLMTLDIALSDWGVASWKDRHLTDLIQPVLLRAPEVIMEAPWGPPVDIWNLGALIPELIYAQCMFSGRDKSKTYRENVHLEEMDKLVGPFPKALLESANSFKDIFNDSGHIQTPELDTFVGLERRFSGIEADEKEKLIACIEAMLVLDPQHRKSAKELLEELWLSHEYKGDTV
ncbi:serine/threonine protein kinase [Phlyctema vagabunda]|uniref:non-specific serine/threonine protein kinase n=1 Tax=Phlyctema vagabunda TaxID=108571 RepID=A0ABR4PCU6_9HELO